MKITDLDKGGKPLLPNNLNMKYGCTICADKELCEKAYKEEEHIVCKYASILDAYKNYAEYDRAAKKDFWKVFRRFPEE